MGREGPGVIYEGPLGQLPPTDDEHRRKYPLQAEQVPEANVPVVLGINWHRNFDRPEKVGNRYFIGRGELGSVRGGHAVCLLPAGVRDYPAWWRMYDQGREGACVGFATCRMLTLLNRERYDAFELYRQAQRQDEWPGEAYSGTSVRAGFDVARERGPYQLFRSKLSGPNLGDGIAANRWARNMDDLLAALGTPNAATVRVLNSWGRNYPHIVHMPVETADRVIFREGGEAAVPTDR